MLLWMRATVFTNYKQNTSFCSINTVNCFCSIKPMLRVNKTGLNRKLQWLITSILFQLHCKTEYRQNNILEKVTKSGTFSKKKMCVCH